MSRRPDGRWRMDDKVWRRLRLEILERDGWRCQIRGPRCTGRAEEVDHIHTLKDGGPRFEPSNLRAACAKCNRGRRDRKIRIAASREW